MCLCSTLLTYAPVYSLIQELDVQTSSIFVQWLNTKKDNLGCNKCTHVSLHDLLRLFLHPIALCSVLSSLRYTQCEHTKSVPTTSPVGQCAMWRCVSNILGVVQLAVDECYTREKICSIRTKIQGAFERLNVHLKDDLPSFCSRIRSVPPPTTRLQRILRAKKQGLTGCLEKCVNCSTEDPTGGLKIAKKWITKRIQGLVFILCRRCYCATISSRGGAIKVVDGRLHILKKKQEI